jgi:hypothetical protein
MVAGSSPPSQTIFLIHVYSQHDTQTIEKDGYDLNAALESLQTAKDVVEVCDSLFAYLHAVMDKRPHELSNEDQEKENRRKKYRTKEAPLPVKVHFRMHLLSLCDY